jgi:hypothetical protein
MSLKKSLWASLLTLFLFSHISFAQKTLKIQDASSKYDLTVQFSKCEGDSDTSENCDGPGRVSIYRKGAKAPFQIFSLPYVSLDMHQSVYDPELYDEKRGLYGTGYGFVIEDLNLDGVKDLAIRNGSNGGYGGPSYTVYLFNKGANKFVENKPLSKLADGPYLGLFFVETKKKLLVAQWKDGCCFHQTEKYRVVADKPVLVEEITEDVDMAREELVVTTRRLVGGKWIKKVRREKPQ